MTKEEKLKELKKELDDVENQNFYNNMVDRWTSENYEIEFKTSKRIQELENEIKKLESE